MKRSTDSTKSTNAIRVVLCDFVDSLLLETGTSLYGNFVSGFVIFAVFS